MPRSGIAGSSGSTMSNFLRNHKTDFQSGCISLQPCQQWRSVSLFPHSHQHLLSPEFLNLAILTGNLRVVLIWIFLITKNIKHFKVFLSHLISSVNSLFSSVPYFLIGLFDSLQSNFLSSLYIFDISPLSNVGLLKIFPKSVGCPFVLLTVFFALQKHCNFIPFVNPWS